MTRYEFMEKIAFFMCDKTGDIWEGKLEKEEQVEFFGSYLGKGVLVVNQITMTVKHNANVYYYQVGVINKVLDTEGVCVDGETITTPLFEL